MFEPWAMHYGEKGGGWSRRGAPGARFTAQHDLNDLVALFPGLSVGPTTAVPCARRRIVSTELPCGAPAASRISARDTTVHRMYRSLDIFRS